MLLQEYTSVAYFNTFFSLVRVVHKFKCGIKLLYTPHLYCQPVETLSYVAMGSVCGWLDLANLEIKLYRYGVELDGKTNVRPAVHWLLKNQAHRKRTARL